MWRSLCSPLASKPPLKLFNAHINVKSGDYCTLSPGNQPVLFLRSPGDILARYSGLCVPARWVSQRNFCAAASHTTGRCTLTVSPFLYSLHLTPVSGICKPVPPENHWGVPTSFPGFTIHSFASPDCISSPALELFLLRQAVATPAAHAQGLARTPEC